MQVNNIEFNYELYGHGDNTIVFISPYTGGINAWREVADALSQQNQVLIFDNQGIGATVDDGGDLTAEVMAANIKSLCDALEIQSATVVGGAFGSCIAQSLAHQFPEFVKQVFLLGSVIQFSDEAKNICEQICCYRENNDLKSYAEVIYELCFSQQFLSTVAKDTFVKEYSGVLKQSQTAVGQRRQVEALKAFDSSQWLSEIKVPAVVIAPEKDYFSSPDECKALANRINGHYVEIKQQAHAILKEDPAAVVKVIQENLPG